MMILGIPIDLMIKLCLLPLNTILDSKLMIKLIWAVWGLFLDEFWHVSCRKIESNLQNCRWPCCFWGNYDMVIFFFFFGLLLFLFLRMCDWYLLLSWLYLWVLFLLKGYCFILLLLFSFVVAI